MNNKPSRKCRKCGERKPLSAEHFRRDINAPKGYQVRCKICSADAIKVHYRPWKKIHVDERGSFGVRCVLHSPACGVCPVKSEDDMSACWRLEDYDEDDEEYPIAIE